MTIAQEFKRIELENGFLTPQKVVAEAKIASSPLHKNFEWNDGKAAHEYRLQQARWLIREIKVTVNGEQRDNYYNVTLETGERGYVSRENMVSKIHLVNQVLANAVAEITHWQDKYKEIQELKGIVNEDKLKKVAVR